MPDRKINFCSKFAIKNFPCYRCKCWYWNVFPYIIIWYAFEPHAGEIWTKSYGPKWTNIWAFWQKKKQVKTKTNKKQNILTMCWRHFERRLCSSNNCLTINYYFSDFSSSSVPNIMVVRHFPTLCIWKCDIYSQALSVFDVHIFFTVLFTNIRNSLLIQRPRSS